MDIELFYSRGCRNFIREISNALEKTYGLKTREYKKLEPIESAYNPRRRQYDASILLRHIIQRRDRDFVLWVIDKDLYCQNMNFIFGYASPKQGAVLSVYRLDSKELIQKEAIHEIGHVIGLEHCHNICVMQFSNSLEEARKKPSVLCDECRSLIEESY